MSDILIQSALKEQQRLTDELITAQKQAAEAYSAALVASSVIINEETDMVSAGTYLYPDGVQRGACTPPSSNAGGFPAKNLLCYRNDPAKMGEAVEKQWCAAFHQLWKPRPHGFLCYDTVYHRCNREGTFTVPAGVSKVQVQLWGPGSGSGGYCCQGFSMPGPTGAYMLIDNLEVTPGDTLCYCAGCSYCCYGDGSGVPGWAASYCTSLCLCRVSEALNENYFAPGAPNSHTCRWSCAFCMKRGWVNCCPMQFGGSWYIDDDMEINTTGGCAQAIGAGYTCVGGMNTCGGCWSPCYDSPGRANFMPMIHDHTCLASAPAYNVLRCRNTHVYSVPSTWPSYATDRTCCLGGPYNAGDHWVLAPPVPGFARSFRVSSNKNTDQRSTQTAFGQCCRQQCFGEMACQGVQRFPGVGGSGYATTGTNQLGCGDYGSGGAVCISWACDNEDFDPYAPW
jgi:hypothetical protein